MYSKRPRIIPVLLLSDDGMVKTVKFKKPTYLGDPINAVKIFNEKEVDELCLLDIDATKKGKEPNFKWLSDIASEAFMPLSYGGGITNIEQIRTLFKIGFEKVILNTSLIKNPSLVSDASKIAGSQSIVVSIDAKKSMFGKYFVVINDGMEKVDISPVEAARMAESLGAGEIIINSVDCDGMMQGYDEKLVSAVVEAVNIPVVALGGAGNLEHISKIVNETGAHAAAAGSLFVYYGAKKAVLINFPKENELVNYNIFK